MLTVRDTDAMLTLPVLYLLWKAKFFEPLWNFHFTAWKPWRTLVGIASGMLVIGWSPALYFNIINFGSPFVSTHYQTGIRLSTEYLLHGGEDFMGMPGILVMLFAFLVYHFPFFATMMISRPHWTSLAPVCIMGLMVMFPIMLIHGMFAVAATGAAPRYVLPLVPFTAILTAYGISLLGMKTGQRFSIPIFSVFIIWLLVMTYPPSSLFQVWPRFVYLANYAPCLLYTSADADE